jgi:hypothetical protein
MQAIARLVIFRPTAIDPAAMRRFCNFMHGLTVPNCSFLPLHHHADGSRTLAGLWVPGGIEVETVGRNQAGQAGV